MKNYIRFIILLTIGVSAAACQHPGKESVTNIQTQLAPDPDDITKDILTDDLGQHMEVITNHTAKTVTIHLDGKTYELKKKKDMPEYSAANTEYQYTDIKGEVIFLKRDIQMVLFHLKKPVSSENKQKSTSMASY
ncbi:hypothetical protein [uncultured Chryseobacterium sp.]|uniref:hypothetical protein n=1 Tax=uncultured Chryseobacterium sp. TaxID=259322 RepID=UPI0025F7F9F6|nr:hypothetical protein [uncultured Chryseobacterium sp.]